MADRAKMQPRYVGRSSLNASSTKLPCDWCGLRTNTRGNGVLIFGVSGFGSYYLEFLGFPSLKMDTLSELVEKKRLFHRFQHPYTIHVSLDLGHDGEHQPEVQKWRREQGIGAGGGGKVFLEVLEVQTSEAGQPAKYKFRAVKEIARSGVTDQTYKRELKAIFNFSQKKV